MDSESESASQIQEKMKNGMLRESANRSLESSANRSTSIEGQNVNSVQNANRVVEVDENFKKYMNNLHRYMETGTIKTPEKQKEEELSDIQI